MSFGSKSSPTPARPEPVTTAIPLPKPTVTAAQAAAKNAQTTDDVNTTSLLKQPSATGASGSPY